MQNKQSFSYYLNCKLVQEFQDISAVLLKSGKKLLHNTKTLME